MEGTSCLLFLLCATTACAHNFANEPITAQYGELQPHVIAMKFPTRCAATQVLMYLNSACRHWLLVDDNWQLEGQIANSGVKTMQSAL